MFMEIKQVHTRQMNKRSKNRFIDIMINDGFMTYYIMTKNKAITFTITRYWDNDFNDCKDHSNEQLPAHILTAYNEFISAL